MKAIHALLLLMFIYIAKADVPDFNEQRCEDYTYSTRKPAFSLDFCRSTNLGNAVRCCFVKLEINDQRLYHCQPINATVWADIDLLEDELEGKGYEVESIECSSSYLYVSLLLLFALLI